MRRWAMRFAGLAALALAAGALLVYMFLARPETMLTSRTVAVMLPRLGAAWSPRWSRLAFSADAFERRRHRYVLSASDFCVADPKGAFTACFSELELAAVVFYSRRGPVLESVERLVAVSADARADLRLRDPAAKGGLPASLRAVPVETLRVELSSFTLIAGKTSVSGAFRAVLAPEGRRPLAVSTDLKLTGEGAGRLKAELTADTDLLKGRPATFVDVIGRVDLGKRGRARASFRAKKQASGYTGSGSAELTASSGPIRSIRLTGCRGDAPLAKGSKRPSSGELSCRYEIEPARSVTGPFGAAKLATGKASLAAGAGPERWQAVLKADLEPIAAWGRLAGGLVLKAGGRLDRPLSEAEVAHELHAAAEVQHFEELVAFLRDTKYAVPAPIHVLKGPLALSVESRGDTLAPRLAVKYAFSSDLTGPRQRLILRAKGEVTAVNALEPERSFEHDGELILKEVALELPRLDVGRAPKVTSDKRIKLADDKPPAAALASGKAIPFPPMRARLAVKTEKPLLLFSNLAKDPVPIALDLVAAYPPASAGGLVSVRTFNVELFRRNATVDHLNVTLSPGSKVGALEGLIRYKTSDADIRIVILGTTEKPIIEFLSVPPMKREDVIALLIFGKTPDELDPDQTASVSNTETALESRAFGLASLYLFGATPIEHVGYDPATKTTMVKLRLPGGANLTLGADTSQNRQLTVRKPLAPHWAIQSEFTDQGSQQTKAAATFLEWFNRY
jgi:hypothetical protein